MQGARLAKGTRLTSDDLRAARAAGHEELMVARPDADDILEDDAALRLGRAAAGEGLIAQAPVHGRVDLHAGSAGLLRYEPARVDAVNAHDEAIGLAALPPLAPLRAGDIAATLKSVTFALPPRALKAAERDAAAHPLTLAPFRPLAVHLIQTEAGAASAKMMAKTLRVTRARVEALGGVLTESRTAHDVDALAASIAGTRADLLLVAGASATADRRDTVPAAISFAGGETLRLGMPVDPGNLLLLGRRGNMPIVGMPGCARSPKRNGFDFVLERLFAGIGVESPDLARMGPGGYLHEAERPDRAAARPEVNIVGAIGPAAGRWGRMGANKLGADFGDGTVLGASVAAARGAGLPVLVVTGHQAGEVRAALPADVATVHASGYASGLSASLAAGLGAAPADWDAALVLLGDMPLVEPDLLARMAGTAVHADDIVVPVHHGRRGNPVLWGRQHFAALQRLEGDVGGKAVMAAHEEQLIEVEAPTDAIFMDVDTPQALARARERLRLR